jgi:hypothetical protein
MDEKSDNSHLRRKYMHYCLAVGKSGPRDVRIFVRKGEVVGVRVIVLDPSSPERPLDNIPLIASGRGLLVMVLRRKFV